MNQLLNELKTIRDAITEVLDGFGKADT